MRKIDITAILVVCGVGASLLFAIMFIVEGTAHKKYENMPLSIIFFIAFIIGLVHILQEYKTKMYLHTARGSVITLLYNTPSEEAVTNFIAELKKSQKEYYIKNYGKVDKLLPIEPQVNKLIWLLENNFLEIGEFEEKKNMLLQSKPGENQIGFR